MCFYIVLDPFERVSKYLREQQAPCKMVLVDVPGSSLLARVKYGVAFR